jgi:hypothetical protein
MSSSYQETQTNNNMKNTIKAIVFAIISSVSALQAGEPALPQEFPDVALEQPTLKVNAFATSLLNEDADALYGGGVSIETVSLHNVSLRASLVALEDETLALGGSALFTVPVSQTFSLYALGGVDYEFDQEFWSASAGGGATLALSQRLNLFVESAYSFAIDSDNEDKGWGVSAGVGIKF